MHGRGYQRSLCACFAHVQVKIKKAGSRSSWLTAVDRAGITFSTMEWLCSPQGQWPKHAKKVSNANVRVSGSGKMLLDTLWVEGCSEAVQQGQTVSLHQGHLQWHTSAGIIWQIHAPGRGVHGSLSGAP
jgi:hypothetical protein